MKLRGLIYTVILIGVLVSCTKDDDTVKEIKKPTIEEIPTIEQYENANSLTVIDTTIYGPKAQHELETVNYDLDIDSDGTADLSFMVVESPQYKNYSKLIRIKTLNNFEFAVQESYEIREGNLNEHGDWTVDSVLVEIPKILETNDTISNSLSYESDWISLAAHTRWSYNGSFGENYTTGFKDLGIKHIGLRDQANDVFCRVKVEVIDYQTIRIIDYYYTIGEEFLIIEE